MAMRLIILCSGLLLCALVTAACPQEKCEQVCLLGFMKDDAGCELCECKTNGIIEDDILVNDKTYPALKYRYSPNLETQKRRRRAAMRDVTMQWPKVGKLVPVPYVFHRFLPYSVRAAILKGIREFDAKTCIRLIPQTTESNYVQFSNFGGCNSFIGMTGGPQTVNLATNCIKHGTVLHEIMHLLGFWHEQSRGDRDDFITILWQNLIPGTEGNFEKIVRDWNPYGSKYDYNSVMHYGGYYNSKIFGVAPTIVNKFTGVPIKAQRERFTKEDLFQINMKYGCTDFLDEKVSREHVAAANTNTCVDKIDRCNLLTSRHNCRENDYVKQNCFKSCTGCTVATTQAPTVTTKAPVQNCQDRNQNCAFWASHNLCQIGSHVQYMQTQCRKSCNLCYNVVQITRAPVVTTTTTTPASTTSTTTQTTTTQATTTTQPTVAPSGCADKLGNCEFWASQNFCHTGQYVTFMRAQCKKSCQLCNNVISTTTTTTTAKTTTTTPAPTTKTAVISTPLCRDGNRDCPFWSRGGLCTSGEYIDFMAQNCKKSCDLCFENARKAANTCDDKSETCEAYKLLGFCSSQRTYMEEQCMKACGFCETQQETNEEQCGVTAQAITGDTAVVRSPWIASIRSLNGKHICGGSLISKQHLVTSAQCFGNARKLNSNIYFAYLGKNQINEKNHEQGQFKVKFSNITRHPKYDYSTNAHDIAIVKLSQPVSYSRRIRPICLPRQGEHSDKQGSISGWIETKGQETTHLQQVEVETITNEQCKTYIGNLGLNTDVITSDVFCASHTEVKENMCMNDNGIPLTTMQGQSHVLTGIASFGFRCGWRRRPGGYTKVAEKVRWINSILNN